jgi:hypothetical protein
VPRGVAGVGRQDGLAQCVHFTRHGKRGRTCVIFLRFLHGTLLLALLFYMRRMRRMLQGSNCQQLPRRARVGKTRRGGYWRAYAAGRKRSDCFIFIFCVKVLGKMRTVTHLPKAGSSRGARHARPHTHFLLFAHTNLSPQVHSFAHSRCAPDRPTARSRPTVGRTNATNHKKTKIVSFEQKNQKHHQPRAPPPC